MIYLTYNYPNAILENGVPILCVVKVFPSIEVREYKASCVILQVSLADFHKSKSRLPTKGLIKIEGRFNLLERIAYGVESFSNEL